MLDRNSTAHLDRRVRYRAADVVPFSPITEPHVNDGLTIGELCDAAIRYSDNTAGNLLLDDLGGSGEITTFARSLGDRVTRLDRREPELNSAVPDCLASGRSAKRACCAVRTPDRRREG
jgi:beta-lactamase class A